MKNLTYALIVLSGLLLTACGGGSDDATEVLTFDPFVNQYDADAYNIGLFPLYSYRGDASLLAAQQINAAGGILGGQRINIISVFFQTVDAFEIVDVQAVAQQMIETYGIQMLATGSSYIFLKLAEITIPHQALLLSDSATSPAITRLEDNDLAFRLPPSDVIAGKVLAELAWNDGARYCSVLFTENEAYGQGLSSAFSQAFQDLGGTILASVVIPQDVSNDFSPYFNDLLGKNPDCVFPALLRSTTVANLVNEAASLYTSGFYVFSDAAFAQGFVESIARPEVLSGSIAVTPGFGLRDSPEYLAFASTYRAQYGQEPLNFSAHAYDMIFVMALAAERAGIQNQTNRPTTAMIHDSLRAIMNPPGTAVSPSRIAEALALLRAGEEINFFGASNPDMGWDTQGDVAGQPVYDVYRYDASSQSLQAALQMVIDLPLAE